MQTIYQMTDKCRLGILKQLGWIEIPQTQMVVKNVEVSPDSELIQTVLKETYLNPSWIKQNDLESRTKAKALGLKFKKGKIELTKKFYDNITKWVLSIDLDSTCFLCACSANINEPYTLIEKDDLNKYFYENIKKLKYYDIINEIEVSKK